MVIDLSRPADFISIGGAVGRCSVAELVLSLGFSPK